MLPLPQDAEDGRSKKRLKKSTGALTYLLDTSCSFCLMFTRGSREFLPPNAPQLAGMSVCVSLCGVLVVSFFFRLPPEREPVISAPLYLLIRFGAALCYSIARRRKQRFSQPVVASVTSSGLSRSFFLLLASRAPSWLRRRLSLSSSQRWGSRSGKEMKGGSVVEGALP